LSKAHSLDFEPLRDKEEFLKMLQKLRDYSTAINAKAGPFPSEPVILALLFEQHKLIRWLKSKFDVNSQLKIHPILANLSTVIYYSTYDLIWQLFQMLHEAKVLRV
jgi:hypothetical protein